MGSCPLVAQNCQHGKPIAFEDPSDEIECETCGCLFLLDGTVIQD